jgi:hypothetical protein
MIKNLKKLLKNQKKKTIFNLIHICKKKQKKKKNLILLRGTAN